MLCPRILEDCGMQLSVRDVARILNVSENAIYRWVSDDGLPAERIHGQYRFNRVELLEWATHHKIAISPALFPHPTGHGRPGLEGALRAGGIFYHIKGLTRESVLHAVVRAL